MHLLNWLLNILAHAPKLLSVMLSKVTENREKMNSLYCSLLGFNEIDTCYSYLYGVRSNLWRRKI